MNEPLSTEFKGAVEKVLWRVRDGSIPRTPYAKLKHPSAQVTGNLKYNATKVEHFADYSRIFVDEGIAPYMPYTNEPWISPRWKGAKNPNENWFEDFEAQVAYNLAIELGGELRKIGD